MESEAMARILHEDDQTTVLLHTYAVGYLRTCVLSIQYGGVGQQIGISMASQALNSPTCSA